MNQVRSKYEKKLLENNKAFNKKKKSETSKTEALKKDFSSIDVSASTSKQENIDAAKTITNSLDMELAAILAEVRLKNIILDLSCVNTIDSMGIDCLLHVIIAQIIFFIFSNTIQCNCIQLINTSFKKLTVIYGKISIQISLTNVKRMFF